MQSSVYLCTFMAGRWGQRKQEAPEGWTLRPIY